MGGCKQSDWKRPFRSPLDTQSWTSSARWPGGAGAGRLEHRAGECAGPCLGLLGSSPKLALTVTGRDRGARGLWLVGGTCTGTLVSHLQVVSLKVRLSQITVLRADASSGLPRGPWAAWSLALENQGYIGGWRGGVPAPMQTAQPVSDPYSVPLESAAFLPGTFFPLNPLLPYKRLRVGLAWHPQAPHISKHPQGAGECPRCGGILLGVPWLSSNG